MCGNFLINEHFSYDGDNTKKYKSSFVLGDAIGKKKMIVTIIMVDRGHTIEDA